jgi:hypothetical protein
MIHVSNHKELLYDLLKRYEIPENSPQIVQAFKTGASSMQLSKIMLLEQQDALYAQVVELTILLFSHSSYSKTLDRLV